MTSISEATEQRRPVHAELLSVSEVSAIFRVSKMTVYRMVHAGEIEHVRVGKSYRIFAESVRERLIP
ncbi:MAG TPA: helix-turn-helix domain-containing protein [Pseudonocardia sp.]|nr:helix-turn-helix domain-containing protein [Pseudonocardia sp.]